MTQMDGFLDERTAAENEAVIDAVRAHLSLSKTGRALLDWADENNVIIMLDHEMQPEAGGVYFAGLNTICLSSHIPLEPLATFLGHEIRHAWQDSKGMFPQHVTMNPVDLLLRMRLMEADATAIQLQVAAELAVENEGAAWEYMQNNDFRYVYDKAIDGFHETAMRGKAFVEDGRAALAGFGGWFKSNIKPMTDHRMMQLYNMHGAKRLGVEDPSPELQSSVMLSSKKPDVSRRAAVPGNGFDYRDKAELLKLFELPGGGRYLEDLRDDFMQLDHVFGLDWSHYPEVREEAEKMQRIFAALTEAGLTEDGEKPRNAQTGPRPAHR